MSTRRAATARQAIWIVILTLAANAISLAEISAQSAPARRNGTPLGTAPPKGLA